MKQPGSMPGIPETAKVVFQLKWSKRKPGTKELVGFIDVENGILAVIPYRGWEPKIEVEYEVVLYPLQNAAVAAPVGGF